MKHIIKLVFCLVFLFCTNARAKTEVMFTPSVQCENRIEELIDKSKKTVDKMVQKKTEKIAVYQRVIR